MMITRFALSLVTVGFNFLPLLAPDSLQSHIPLWQTGTNATVGNPFSLWGAKRMNGPGASFSDRAAYKL